jgi:hypothetical protein
MVASGCKTSRRCFTRQQLEPRIFKYSARQFIDCANRSLALLTSLQDLHVPVKRFIDNTPGYPNTEEEATKLLRVVHLRREETELQQRAVKKAIDRCTLQVEMCQPQTDCIRLAGRELEAYHSELALATETVAEAEGDVGVVRAHLRRKGISVQVPSNQYDMLPDGVLTNHEPEDVGDDSDNDSGVMEVAASGPETLPTVLGVAGD